MIAKILTITTFISKTVNICIWHSPKQENKIKYNEDSGTKTFNDERNLMEEAGRLLLYTYWICMVLIVIGKDLNQTMK